MAVEVSDNVVEQSRRLWKDYPLIVAICDELLQLRASLRAQAEPDVEAIAWAVGKLRAFGLLDSNMDNALMADRLEAMLSAAPPTGKPEGAQENAAQEGHRSLEQAGVPAGQPVDDRTTSSCAAPAPQAAQEYGPCSCQDEGRCKYVNGGPACMNEDRDVEATINDAYTHGIATQAAQERLAEEPSLIHATVRDAGDEFHIECRMSDGQKGAFITVDGEFPQLAGIVLDALHNHLAALRQAEAQEGWKLVPIEATPDMCLAGFDAISATPRGSTRRLHMQAVYKAMLAAAPSRTPATGEGK